MSPVVHHHLVIRRTSPPAILLLADGEGWRLPWLVTEDRHTAEVDYLNAAAHARWGILTTVLRCVDDVFLPERQTIVRAYAAEMHNPDDAVPAGLRWCAADEVAAIRWARAADAAAVASALSAEHDGVRHGRGWTEPGWWRDACAWIREELARAGTAAVTRIEQLRAWEFSTVLRVDSSDGRGFFFKALPHSLRREWCVTDYLAREFPGTVPSLVAADAERGWLLMNAFVGDRLEAVADLSAWERAARVYGRLQRACVDRVAALSAIGCDTWSLQRLDASIAPLLADVAAMRPGQGEALTPAEIAAVQSAVPELHRRCHALALSGIPLTLEHGDLWPGNILVNATGAVIIDWEDARIALPFLSLAPLLAGLGMHHPDVDLAAATPRLSDVYLSAFAGAEPTAEMRQALALAQPLAFLEMAARYRDQRPSIVRLHAWMRDMVPFFLRLMLRAR